MPNLTPARPHAVAAPRTIALPVTRPRREPTVLVVVPTYNEAENLPVIARRVRACAPTAAMLVVDDGSPDGTGELADQLAAHDQQIHVLHRTAKNGLGAAYLAGFAWALDRGYDVVVEMDADGSHAPEELHRLLTALDDADLVLGSRYVEGGALRNWPKRRELLSRWGNRYVRGTLGIDVMDATGGFRAFRSEVLRALPLAEIASEGYCFQVELAWRSIEAGYRVREVPITFTERSVGASKMSGAIVAEALLRVTMWGAARLRPGWTR